MSKRRIPYTERGIKRLKCFRCKIRPAVHQWQVCADGNTYRPICLKCDIALNRLVLRWMKINEWHKLLDNYIREQLS